MAPPLKLFDLPADVRVKAVRGEIHTKGHAYMCEDVRRKQLLVVGQRMRHIQEACEQLCGEACALSSLFESASAALKRGRTGSFAVQRVTRDELPALLEERRRLYGRMMLQPWSRACQSGFCAGVARPTACLPTSGSRDTPEWSSHAQKTET
jgi:hypothetical protein